MRSHTVQNRTGAARPAAGTARGFAVAGAMLLALVLGACGGTAGSSGSTSGTGTGTGGGGGGTPISMSVSLVDSTQKPITLLGPTSSATAVATLSGGTASQIANQVVTFSVGSSTLVAVNPVTALTNASGVATATVNATGAGAGALTLGATVTIGSTSYLGSTNFSVGQSTNTGLAISSVVAAVGSGSLSSYGTTDVIATITSNGQVPSQPVTVTFTSTCPSGKATVTASAATLPDGTAHATFSDNGCAPTSQTSVTVTASITSGSKGVSFLVNPPTAGSIQFVSSNPGPGTSITLKGQGGAGRQEYATLTFSLVDVAGHGVPTYPICFDATTYVGGLTVDGFNNVTPPAGSQKGTVAQCGSDNTLFYLKNTDVNGNVTVQVNSGTSPTPVRVRARALYPASATALLETLSGQLTISTGLPIDHNMDLSVDKANIDGYDYSGITANLTVRLADIFGNPVADGTQVTFVTSGGAICTSSAGSCTTLNGSCSCALTSQAFRPLDGRVVVLAYVIGEPDFIDNNHNYQFDAGDTFTPLGDAYLDANKNGQYDTTAINGETDKCFPYINGQACSPLPGAAGTTTGYGPVFLRRQGIVYFSRGSGNSPTVIIPSGAFATATGGFYAGQPVVPIPTTFNAATPPAPTSCVSQVQVQGYLEDGFGNPMAAGTNLTTGSPSATQPSVGTIFPTTIAALGARPPAPGLDAPNLPRNTVSNVSAAGSQIIGSRLSVPITITNTPATNCAGDFSFQIFVTSPSGPKTPAKIVFEGENPSTVNRYVVPMHFQ